MPDIGKTAELVRTARSANRQEHEIVGVVRNLFVVNAAMVVILAGYAHYAAMSLGQILRLLLSVLCSDKTGTLTRNEATVTAVWAAPGFREDDVVRAAALASDPAGQDPVDGAIVKAATDRGWHEGEGERIDFSPFDPVTKRAEAVYREEHGSRRYVKGAPAAVAKLALAAESVWRQPAEGMAGQGQRVLAVAVGDERVLSLAGLLGLDTRSLQTLTFATLILSSQAGVYLLRERGHFWQSRPGGFLMGSTVLGLGVTALLALVGILMPAVGAPLLLAVAGVGTVCFVALDWVKIWLFQRLDLR